MIASTYKDFQCHNDRCRWTPDISPSNTDIVRCTEQPDKDFLEVQCLNPKCKLCIELPPGVSVELAESLGCPVRWVEDAPPLDLFDQLSDELNLGVLVFRPLEHRDECLLRDFHHVLFDREEPTVPLATAEEWLSGVGDDEAELFANWLESVSPHRIWQELLADI